ncbi:UbiA prenyltransferase domain-containing protein 1 [Durusdinium trenchii]|uniref:UbiA prenyltransferase domain-containing protein 1 n=1 Tax=Durusdinium trenchii TaxID=1381693 RepID=A0ABP0HDN3_9DINO
MVIPAVKPLPYEFAVSLHLVHIIFGLFGALFVLVSGFDTAGRTALTKGTSMMLVFMGTITWTWWINRQGVLYWDLDVWRNVESAVEWDFFFPNLAWGCLVSWV